MNKLLVFALCLFAIELQSWANLILDCADALGDMAQAFNQIAILAVNKAKTTNTEKGGQACKHPS
jgi:hypothetical protein